MSIEAAGVWQKPSPGGPYLFRLEAWPGVRLSKGFLKSTDTKHSQGPGAELVDLSDQHFAALLIFRVAQFVGPRRGAFHEACDADAAFQKLVLLGRVEQAVGETGAVKGFPEPVAGSGEVKARSPGIQPRIDAAE